MRFARLGRYELLEELSRELDGVVYKPDLIAVGVSLVVVLIPDGLP